MKKLKYLKLFEAFESNKLSKTLGYIKSGKNDFLEKLKAILKTVDFPESKISDDYIEYLPFSKALKKADIITDEPCDATSQQTFPDFAVEGATCEEGKMKRTWGGSVRSVECPVCGGTGVKPKKAEDIKLAKFWFSKDGEFITTTAVDGIIRDSKSKDFQLSNDLSDYRIGRRVSKENLLKLENGALVLINISGRDTICYIFKPEEGYKSMALQYKHFGDRPSYRYDSIWKKIAPRSWSLGGSDHTGGKLLYLKDKSEDREPNPYTWNVGLIFNWGGFSLSRDIRDEIKKAHFALVLDFAKLKKSDFKTKTNIKSEREELKKGAFLTDEEIRSQNIQRYVDTISKSMDIVSDISNVNKMINRLINYKYALFIIASGGTKDTLQSIISNYYDMISSNNESDKEYAIRRIENYVKSSVDNLKNSSNLPNNIEYVSKKLKESNQESHLELLNRLVKTSENIYNKIKSYDIETIEDLEVIHQKILAIYNLFNARRYKSNNLRYFFDSLINSSSSGAYDRFGSSYYGVSEESAKEIIKELDRIDKIISKI